MKTLLFNNTPTAPTKIVCIGRNYVEHIYELENEIPSSMVIFNKPNSALSDRLRYVSSDTRFEGEICFLIMGGKIAGIGFGLDLTKADIQNHLKSKGLPWERAKGFDGSAVLSPFVPFEGPFENLRMTLHIDDRLVQEATFELMIYKPLTMVEEIRSFMSFEDGDIIMSGTPKGVGTYHPLECFIGRVYDGETLLLEQIWTVSA